MILIDKVEDDRECEDCGKKTKLLIKSEEVSGANVWIPFCEECIPSEVKELITRR